MWGEGMREAGVLIAVFGMLDGVLRAEGLTARWTASTLATTLSFFVGGIILERRRR